MTTETFTIGNSTLYCGVCREIIDRLAFDAVVTDPPYGLAKVPNRDWKTMNTSLYRKPKNLHSGGTWATKDICKDIDWDDETPDVTFLLRHRLPANRKSTRRIQKSVSRNPGNDRTERTV